jgi:hypothetical protein
MSHDDQPTAIKSFSLPGALPQRLTKPILPLTHGERIFGLQTFGLPGRKQSMSDQNIKPAGIETWQVTRQPPNFWFARMQLSIRA